MSRPGTRSHTAAKLAAAEARGRDNEPAAAEEEKKQPRVNKRKKPAKGKKGKTKKPKPTEDDGTEEVDATTTAAAASAQPAESLVAPSDSVPAPAPASTDAAAAPVTTAAAASKPVYPNDRDEIDGVVDPASTAETQTRVAPEAAPAHAGAVIAAVPAAPVADVANPASAAELPTHAAPEAAPAPAEAVNAGGLKWSKEAKEPAPAAPVTGEVKSDKEAKEPVSAALVADEVESGKEEQIEPEPVVFGDDSAPIADIPSGPSPTTAPKKETNPFMVLAAGVGFTTSAGGKASPLHLTTITRIIADSADERAIRLKEHTTRMPRRSLTGTVTNADGTVTFNYIVHSKSVKRHIKHLRKEILAAHAGNPEKGEALILDVEKAAEALKVQPRSEMSKKAAEALCFVVTQIVSEIIGSAAFLNGTDGPARLSARAIVKAVKLFEHNARKDGRPIAALTALMVHFKSHKKVTSTPGKRSAEAASAAAPPPPPPPAAASSSSSSAAAAAAAASTTPAIVGDTETIQSKRETDRIGSNAQKEHEQAAFVLALVLEAARGWTYLGVSYLLPSDNVSEAGDGHARAVKALNFDITNCDENSAALADLRNLNVDQHARTNIARVNAAAPERPACFVSKRELTRLLRSKGVLQCTPICYLVLNALIQALLSGRDELSLYSLAATNAESGPRARDSISERDVWEAARRYGVHMYGDFERYTKDNAEPEFKPHSRPATTAAAAATTAAAANGPVASGDGDDEEIDDEWAAEPGAPESSSSSSSSDDDSEDDAAPLETDDDVTDADDDAAIAAAARASAARVPAPTASAIAAGEMARAIALSQTEHAEREFPEGFACAKHGVASASGHGACYKCKEEARTRDIIRTTAPAAAASSSAAAARDAP